MRASSGLMWTINDDEKKSFFFFLQNECSCARRHTLRWCKECVCVCVLTRTCVGITRLLLRAHETLEVGSVDHATVNLELGEGVVDLGGGELVAEGHEGVSEGLGVDLAVNVEGVEGLEDGLVVVSAASHLAGEEGHHLGEVHGAIGLIKHALGLTGGDGLAVVAEGGHQVGGAEETVLVDVHDAEGFLELLQGRVGELVENVGLLGHVEASADEVERELNNK